MNHPRLSQELSQPISENLQKLAALFPAAVKDGALDIDALREELGEFEEIRPGDEKYELSWVGKQAAKKESFKPLLGKTLAFKPEDSKHPETTQNLYIEGDNLEALKLLRQNYFGEVKMIYIDPPYNTGNDFVYTDKFAKSGDESEQEEGAVSETGKRLIKNEKSSNRFHARWLDMMYPTLRLAKDLLCENGVIFVSIDDNEVVNAMNLMNEIFREENAIAIITVLCNPKGRSQDKYVAKCHEYLIAFSKKTLPKGAMSVSKSYEEISNDYRLQDERGYYRELELRNTHREFGRFNRGNLYYALYSNESGEVSMEQDGNHNIAILPVWEDGFEGCWTWGPEKATSEIDLLVAREVRGTWKVYRKAYAFGEEGDLPVKQLKSIWKDKRHHTEKGQAALNELFQTRGKVFQSPKSIDVLKDALDMSTSSQDLILDFFSGSATTAHAVMQLNAEDGGNRHHIMVQIPEVCDNDSEAAKAGYKTIAEIGRERIRRAGEMVKNELHTKAATASKEDKAANRYLADPNSLDIGFKAFRIEDTKINWIRKDLKGEEISFQGMGNQDALDFVPGFTDEDIVYEVMLRQSNIPLTQAITKPVPGANGKRTYLYGESYLISLEETVTKELIETLAALEPTPLKYFFRDSAFGKDIALKDETFRRLNAEIAKNHGAQGAAYTVEFI